MTDQQRFNKALEILMDEKLSDQNEKLEKEGLREWLPEYYKESYMDWRKTHKVHSQLDQCQRYKNRWNPWRTVSESHYGNDCSPTRYHEGQCNETVAEQFPEPNDEMFLKAEHCSHCGNDWGCMCPRSK